jgi:hypothetical protein
MTSPAFASSTNKTNTHPLTSQKRKLHALACRTTISHAKINSAVNAKYLDPMTKPIGDAIVAGIVTLLALPIAGIISGISALKAGLNVTTELKSSK